MLVYYFVPFIISNRYLLFWVLNGHNSVTVQNRTHVYMNFFDHKDLGNHLLQLCPKVVKHPVYLAHLHWRNTGPQHGLYLLGLKKHIKTRTYPPTPTSIRMRYPGARIGFRDFKRHRLRRQCDGLALLSSVICVPVQLSYTHSLHVQRH